MTPEKPDRTLVLIYSCGAEVGHDGLKCDYLGSYVRDVFKAWLPDGYSRIFRIVCVWPFGLLDYGSATLRCKI